MRIFNSKLKQNKLHICLFNLLSHLNVYWMRKWYGTIIVVSLATLRKLQIPLWKDFINNITLKHTKLFPEHTTSSSVHKINKKKIQLKNHLVLCTCFSLGVVRLVGVTSSRSKAFGNASPSLGTLHEHVLPFSSSSSSVEDLQHFIKNYVKKKWLSR